MYIPIKIISSANFCDEMDQMRKKIRRLSRGDNRIQNLLLNFFLYAKRCNHEQKIFTHYFGILF